MKLWYHVFASIVGLAIAALIVYLVFGNASQEGATQDGSAGSLASGSSGLCGSVDAAKLNSASTRALAAKNLPALSDDAGPFTGFKSTATTQKLWVARVHAAAGLCTDEINIDPKRGTTISMSTVKGVDDATASTYVIGALTQAFTAPFNPPKMTVTTSGAGSERTVMISRRAWLAFQASRTQRKLPATMHNLALFARASAFTAADLRVLGWS